MGRCRADVGPERHAALTEVATGRLLPHEIAVEFFGDHWLARDENWLPGAKCRPGEGNVAHAEAFWVVDTSKAEVGGTRLPRTPLELLSIDADVEVEPDTLAAPHG